MMVMVLVLAAGKGAWRWKSSGLGQGLGRADGAVVGKGRLDEGEVAGACAVMREGREGEGSWGEVTSSDRRNWPK